MSAIVPRNTADLTLRSIPVMLVEDDGITPANVSTTGLRPQVRRVGSGGGFTTLSADLHVVSASLGEYEVRLTQTEANQPSGNYRGVVPTTSNSIQMPFTFQIGPPNVFDDPLTPEEYAFVAREEIDNNSEKLDIPVSSLCFPEIVNEATGEIRFRNLSGDVVVEGTFGRDSVSRLPFTNISPVEED